MKIFKVCLLISFAGSLTACGATIGASEGAGYARLSMKAETRSFVVTNDLPFAKQVAAHNEQCAKDKLCRK